MKVVETKNGPSFELTAPELRGLGKYLTAKMEQNCIDREDAIEASTLSEGHFMQRLGGTTTSTASTRMRPWAWVALCESVGADPRKAAKSLGIDIPDGMLADAAKRIEHRRAEKKIANGLTSYSVDELLAELRSRDLVVFVD